MRVKGLPPKATKDEVAHFFEGCGAEARTVVLIAKEKRSAGEVGGLTCRHCCPWPSQAPVPVQGLHKS